MKKICTTLVLLLLAAVGFAQTDGMNYQAVIVNPEGQQVPGTDTSGDVMANAEVILRFSILNEDQIVEYQETQSTTTDAYGMINLVIGGGEPVGNKLFTELDWAGKPKNLYVEIDLNAGTGFAFLSLQKLTFTPQAFHRDIIATGDMTIDGTTTFRGDLVVEGQTILDNDIEISGDLIVREDLDIIDDLNVGGRTTLGENLSVAGITDLSGDLSVFNGSNTNLTGALQVGAAADIADNLSVGKNAAVSENLFVQGDQTNGGNFSAIGNGSFNGDFEAGGMANIGETLFVGGVSTLNNDLSVAGETNLLGRLNVQSITTIGGTLTVAEETTIEDDFNVSGDGDFANAVDVGAKLTVGQSLEVGGNSLLNGALKVDGANLTQLTGILEVDDVTNLNKGLNVNFATPTFLSGTLQVVKPAVFDDDVLIDGMLTVNNNINLSNLVVSGNNGVAGDHIALFENLGEANSDGVAIRIASENLNSNNNFITFYGMGDYVAGRIESYDLTDGEDIVQNQGIVYGSKGADYAEWLEKEDPMIDFQPGEIVGVKAGKISKVTEGADHILTISIAPIVLGNMPDEKESANFEMVGFMGQVPALVLGPVRKGDYIIASGNNDGTAIAISEEKITLEQLAQVVGRAWSSSSEVEAKLIKVSVGLKSSEWVTIMKQQETRLQSLEKEVDRLQKISEKIKSLEKRLDQLDTN